MIHHITSGVLVWFHLLHIQSVTSDGTHHPSEWVLARGGGPEVLKHNRTAGAPRFTASLCELVPIEPCLNLKGYYLCPESHPGRGDCHQPGHYYCPYWGCETISSSWSPPTRDEFLKMSWGPDGCDPPRHDLTGGSISHSNCLYLNIDVLQPEDPAWREGRMWGLRYWEPGMDRGGLILIQKRPIPVKPKPTGLGEGITDKFEQNKTGVGNPETDTTNI